MNRLLLTTVCLFVLSGCSLFKAETRPDPIPIKVVTEQIQLEIYQPPAPHEIQLDGVTWYVLTEKNLAEKVAEIKKFTGSDFVVFAMTPKSYENMAENLQEIRRFIKEQSEQLKYYKEATKPKGPIGWSEKTQLLQQKQLDDAATNYLNANQPVVQPVPEKPGFFRRLLPF